jgi:ring-1,2-phenylacetyl-CoA epoxidase subunit PaaD
VVTATAIRPPDRSSLADLVRQALGEVMDPEIPAVSVVDLGIILRIEASREMIRVEILPTFVGCPAIDAIKLSIEERLAGFAERVEVAVSFEIPWTSDRINARGRRRLRASGFGPPLPASDVAPGGLIPLLPRVACPHCGSRRTALENAFGPTLCRSIYYCTDCRQPFEQFKTV